MLTTTPPGRAAFPHARLRNDTRITAANALARTLKRWSLRNLCETKSFSLEINGEGHAALVDSEAGEDIRHPRAGYYYESSLIGSRVMPQRRKACKAARAGTCSLSVLSVSPKLRSSLMIDVSICMVSLDSRGVIAPCLDSIGASDRSVEYEIIDVDNGSTDGTCEWLAKNHPGVRLIRNDKNVGFTRATNQAIGVSSGRLILWLNTDTILRSDSLKKLVNFIDSNPKAGIVGPRLLNADGSFQPQCRRGMPTPWASLAYMLRLQRLWPRSEAANAYLLSHLSVDVSARVTAVSGACLLARREVWEEIGPLDEEIFGFGEDLDWCVRASNAGWEVWYEPASEVIHLKGQGGAHSKPFHKIWGIHQAMWVFYRKHLRHKYPAVFGAVVWLGIAGKLAATTAGTWVRRNVFPNNS